MLGSRKSQRTIGCEEMKKNILLNTIIVLLLIIMGVSLVISGFMVGKGQGFGFIGIVSFVYLMILIIVKK